MSKLTRRVTINAPVDKVFDFALDVGDLWASYPDVAIREVELKPGGVGTSARIYTHGLGLHMEGVIEYTEVVPNERIVAVVTFGPEKPKWTFRFAAVDAGTEVTAQGEWHIKIPGVGGPLEDWMAKSHAKFLEEGLEHIKSRVEAGA